MRSTLPAFNEVWQCQFKQRLLNQLQSLNQQSRIVIGCSGGMDSMLLLRLLFEIVPHRLHVISIDHQLQSQSIIWANFVGEFCQKIQIPYQIIAVEVAAGNLEAEARAARYQAFMQHLLADDILVLGHHQQDQAETVLLRLLQGTGVQGLSAMRECEQRQNLYNQQDFWLWRPLLALSRTQINTWIKQLNIEYIDDPMNHHQHYDRVWCREQLWPLLQQRFPKMQQSIVRCADLMQDAQDILQDVLALDKKLCFDKNNRLILNHLLQLSLPRQRQLLSYWMQADAIYRPPLAMVERLQTELIYAREDAQSLLHYAGYYFVRFDGLLYRYTQTEWQKISEVPEATQIKFNSNDVQIALGSVILIDVQQGLDQSLLAESLTLIPRKGGEKIMFYGRKGHRILKKELQNAKIAPWLRHQIQILMYHNTILGVFTPKGFWLAESAFCKAQGWLPNLKLQ